MYNDEQLHIKGFDIDLDKIVPHSYLRGITALSGLNTWTFRRPITFFVGENGSGKSTLLEALAVAYGFNPEGGTKNYSFSTCNSHSELHDAIRLSKGIYKPGWGYFLRAESFYNVATAEREYMEGKSQRLHEMSHGESFLAMIQKNFKPNGIFFLDEPEAALSPQRQLTLLLEIVSCARDGAQFIIATHSPILLGIPDAEILSFDNGLMHSIPYEESDSYQVTEMFINHRQRILHQLLDG